MPRRIIRGTILKTIESRKRKGFLIKAKVSVPGKGVLEAVFAPGVYSLLPSEKVLAQTEVLLSLDPVPTILGVIKDE